MKLRDEERGSHPLTAASGARLGRAVVGCGAFACLVGLTALVGWFSGNAMLQSFFSGTITIKTNAAISLLLTGLSLLLQASPAPAPIRSKIGRALAGVVAMVGAATLSEHLFGWNLGIDQLLFHEAPGALATTSPNRMGVPASICFPLLGTALLLLGRQTRNGHAPAQPLALMAMLIASISLLGYVFNIHELYGVARYTGIALHTSLSFILLGLGVLLARPDVGVMRRVMANDGGGLLIRRMLPAAILLPIVIGWLRIAGENAGLYDAEFGRILLIFGFILVFSGLIWWMGGILAARSPGETDVRAAEPHRITPGLVQTRLHDIAVVGFGLIVAVLVVGAGLGYLNARRLIENDRRAAHAQVVLLELEALLSTVKDAETGQRGYLLTRDESYLQPYGHAARRIQVVFTHLRELTSAEQEPQARLGVIAAKLAVKMDELERTIAFAKRGEHSAALKIVQGGAGKVAMDELREAVARMHDFELERLRRRHAESEASASAILFSILLAATIGVVLVVLVFYLNQRALALRQRAAAILHEQREWFSTTLSSIGDAVIATDVEGRVTFVNAVAQYLTGWTEEAIGQPLESVFVIVNEKTRSKVENPAQRALHAGRIVGLANHTMLIAKDGTERPIDDSASPIRNQQGEIIGAVLIFRDITERRREEEERQQHVKQLAEADRMKDEFLATLAHELRNPLAPVRNSVEILKAQGSLNPELVWARDVIDRQVGLMARLLDDLLDVSRITRHRLDLRKQRVPVAHIVERGLEASRPLIDAAGHRLDVSLPAVDLWLDVDPVRMSQVVSNLLNNAAKYTRRGGRIGLNVERQGSDVVLSVEDNGIGISPDHLPRVFEIFAQATPALERSEGGLGIGLSLVRGIVEAHGGHAEAHSEGMDRGSTFVVRLPGAPTTDLEASPKVEIHGEVPLKAVPLRILVADDNADAAESLAMMLQLAGHETYVARDGLEAVELAGRVRPDLVLLDIGMPKLNGYDAARRIRDQAWGKGIVLAALTGWGQQEDRQRAAESGFDHHLVKPVEPSALASLLQRLGARAPMV